MPLDLSERHLAWFALTPHPENEFDPQAGEGLIATDNEGDNRMNTGGMPLMATMLFSSGIGPALESEVPYRNDAGLIDEDGDGHWSWSQDGGWSVSEDLRSIQAYELEESVILPQLGSMEYEGEIDLSDPSSFDPSKNKYQPNYEAWTLVKQELMAGRALGDHLVGLGEQDVVERRGALDRLGGVERGAGDQIDLLEGRLLLVGGAAPAARPSGYSSLPR